MKTKLIILGLISAFASLFAVNAVADTPIAPADLPKESRIFLEKHFRNDPVVVAERDRNIFKTEYSVKLRSGADLDFDKDGRWEDIDCKRCPNGVPESIVPKTIRKYVETNYPGNKIHEIGRDNSKYEVELSNGADLEFNLDGSFRRID